MKLFVIVGEVLLIGLIIASIVIDTPIVVFIDIPSILIVVGVTFALQIISFKLDEINKAFSLCMGGSGTQDEIRKSVYFFESMVRNLLYSGVIGMMIGLIKMLQNLSNPETIGPSMAVASLTVIYSFVLIIICPLPSIYTLQKQLLGDDSGMQNEGGA